MSKMDEVNAHIHQQSSISSDSNGEETVKVECKFWLVHIYFLTKNAICLISEMWGYVLLFQG